MEPRPTENGTEAGAESNAKPTESTSKPDADPKEGSGQGVDVETAKQNIVAALQTVYDPEIPVNIYELGMIYDIQIEENGAAYVKMTLTSPACPVAGSLPGEVEAKVAGVPEVTAAKVELVWDPPWNPSMMSEAAKLQTGMMF